MPYDVVLADLNGDGKPDIVTPSQTGNTVSVLLNKGNGTYATAVSYAAGSSPDAVAIGDFNGDGKLDIAVADETGNNVDILLGNGNGTFSAATSYSTGSNTGPIWVATADLNGDGKLDLVTADINSNTGSVLFGNGNGTFGAPHEFPAQTEPGFVITGDFNGDGSPDFAIPNNNSASVSVLLQREGYSPLGAPIALSPGLTVSDADTAQLASATVKIAAGTYSGDGDVLAATTTGTSITASYNSTTEILTLSGSDTLAHYQQVLRTVAYSSTASDPTDGGLFPTRTITWQLNDGSASNNLSTVQSTVITDPPTDPDSTAAMLINDGVMAVPDGTSMTLPGDVANYGTITLGSTGDATSLVIAGSISLMGTGQIILSDNSANSITGDGSGETLTNLTNTITGAGQIGGGSLALVNDGVIDATGSNSLVIDTADNAIVNKGTLQADGGTLAVQSAVTGGGNAIINGGTIAFGAASDANVSFTAGLNGTLQLDQSQGFTGTVAGFGGQDQLDLGDIAFGANSTIGYAANADNSGGTLTVSDGVNTANIALLGQYMASSFATTSDGHGGTMITDPVLAQNQNQLTQPVA